MPVCCRRRPWTPKVSYIRSTRKARRKSTRRAHSSKSRPLVKKLFEAMRLLANAEESHAWVDSDFAGRCLSEEVKCGFGTCGDHYSSLCGMPASACVQRHPRNKRARHAALK